MSTETTYFNNAELALVAYSDFYDGMSQDAYKAALRQDGNGMSTAQAADFASRYTVISQEV